MSASSYQQRIFNKVWNHFIVERGKVGRMPNDRRAAAYHNPDGSKCAIGIFIPEEIYKPAMELNCFETVFSRWPTLCEHMIAEGFLPEDTESAEFSACCNLLSDLQEWHDYIVDNGDDQATIDNRYELADLAEGYELCCPKH